jgi:plasmid stabilization system protein ParE
MEEIQVVWSPLAEEDFEKVFRFVERRWSFQAADNFRSIMYDRVKLLNTNPDIGKPSRKNKKIRKLVITKHNLLLYTKLSNHVIYIIEIIDTRSRRSYKY